MGGRGFESRQKRPKLKDENICILGDASFSHKKSIPDQKGARSSASISRVCPGRVGADPGTHQMTRRKARLEQNRKGEGAAFDPTCVTARVGTKILTHSRDTDEFR